MQKEMAQLACSIQEFEQQQNSQLNNYIRKATDSTEDKEWSSVANANPNTIILMAL